jgi:hypothetical protein
MDLRGKPVTIFFAVLLRGLRDCDEDNPASFEVVALLYKDFFECGIKPDLRPPSALRFARR